MDYNMDDEVVEKLNDADVEEIPPTPVAPSAPDPNFTEQENSYQGSANDYTFESDPDEKTSKVLGIVSLVCGILSLLCCCFTGMSFVLAAAAVVCGIISIKKSDAYKGIAVAGIACGCVGIVVFIILIIIGGAMGTIMNYLNINIDDII